MSFTTVLVEDEPHSLERLKKLLREFDELQIVGEATDGLKAIEVIDELKPDLVLLDIQMPGANGFEVLEKITCRPMVIFVTAYDDYAIKAFENNAVDYLLKPTSSDRVGKAVRRVLQRGQSIDPGLIATLQSAVARGNYLTRFSVNHGDEILIIPADEVHFFQAKDKCVFLATADRNFVFEMTLKELEQSLDPDTFCRIHKSHIVALGKVHKLKRWFNNDLIVQVADGKKTELRVGRGYREELMRRLQG